MTAAGGSDSAVEGRALARALTEPAPAKINLTLRVGAPRPDGYHPLDSLVAFADWGDEIRVSSAPALMLSMGGPYARELEQVPGNLVLRAARALQDAADDPLGAVIHLEKRIPVAAGVGGGSADAAATLRALNRLWGLDWSLDALCEVGLELGADVPACLYSTTLRMQGIGEGITPLPAADRWPAVLVNPGVPVSTGAVFKRFDAEGPTPLEAVAPPADLSDWARQGENDLEPAARLQAPAIGEVLDRLDGAAGCWLARMSGSGATCFGLFDNAGQAEAAAISIGEAQPRWFARAVTLGGPA